MTTYTIENESNNLIGHLSEQDADVVTGAKRFSSEEELANLAASWPTARLVAIFNGLPGVTPVKKFLSTGPGYHPESSRTPVHASLGGNLIAIGPSSPASCLQLPLSPRRTE